MKFISSFQMKKDNYIKLLRYSLNHVYTKSGFTYPPGPQIHRSAFQISFESPAKSECWIVQSCLPCNPMHGKKSTETDQRYQLSQDRPSRQVLAGQPTALILSTKASPPADEPGCDQPASQPDTWPAAGQATAGRQLASQEHHISN